MKKIIYAILFALLTTATVSSCTEEEITPTSTTAQGGNGTDPI